MKHEMKRLFSKKKARFDDYSLDGRVMDLSELSETLSGMQMSDSLILEKNGQKMETTVGKAIFAGIDNASFWEK